MSYKDDCQLKAIMHTNDMSYKYKDEINYSIENTKIYDTDFMFSEPKYDKKEVTLLDCGSTEAIFNIKAQGKIAVLNFASYKFPGGAFIAGSMAQEECLCHDSFLYNVIKEQKEYYDWNNKHLNRAMYLNRALYSKDVRFFFGKESKQVDVITCAAPNYKAANRFGLVTDNENLQILKSRIKYVLDIAQDNNIDTLILGAYGCGVFGQDARVVAKIFKELLTTYYNFKNIIFAIPNINSDNFKKFAKGIEE